MVFLSLHQSHSQSLSQRLGHCRLLQLLKVRVLKAGAAVVVVGGIGVARP